MHPPETSTLILIIPKKSNVADAQDKDLEQL